MLPSAIEGFVGVTARETSVGAGEATDKDRVLEAVSTGELESLTLTLTLNVPTTVGVPLIVPPVLMLSPAGKPLAVHV